MTASWKDYEVEILELLKAEFPDSQISENQFREGRYSKTQRQIDILIEGTIAGHRFSVVIDAKYYARSVDVKGVEEFIGMVNDIGAHKGLIITKEGYSDAALERAFNDPLDIELDILNFKQLEPHQGPVAIPWSGKFGALFKAPFGWIVDGTQHEKPSPPAHLYQRGLTMDEAVGRGEFMYVQFWDRTKDGDDLSKVLEQQKSDLEEHDPCASIEYLQTVTRNDAKTCLRLAKLPKYGNVEEYTGFVEFKDFVLFIVLLTPRRLAKKNIRKLESVMLDAMPIEVRDETRH